MRDFAQKSNRLKQTGPMDCFCAQRAFFVRCAFFLRALWPWPRAGQEAEEPIRIGEINGLLVWSKLRGMQAI